MKIYKVLSTILHLLMLCFWSLSSLLFINLALNTPFRIYIQEFFCFKDPAIFMPIGITMFCICLILAFILVRQNRASSLCIASNNQSHEIGASFMKDLVERFFIKNSIEYTDLDVVLHKERLKIFVKSKSIDLKRVAKFEKDLGDALIHQLDNTNPFKISFALFES
jgi:hypothetical protein